jgi:hypothetical protein
VALKEEEEEMGGKMGLRVENVDCISHCLLNVFCM